MPTSEIVRHGRKSCTDYVKFGCTKHGDSVYLRRDQTAKYPNCKEVLLFNYDKDRHQFTRWAGGSLGQNFAKKHPGFHFCDGFALPSTTEEDNYISHQKTGTRIGRPQAHRSLMLRQGKKQFEKLEKRIHS